MILIWGWRSRLKSIGSGTFHCPNCQADRPYVHQQARRWFTFFFLPLIPLKVLGTFIECSACKSGYDERVLTMPTNAAMADNLSIALRGIVVSVAASDGVVTDAERAMAIQVVSNQVEHAYGPAEFEADLAAFAEHRAADVLGQLAATLNEHGKERFVQLAIEVAQADGSIDAAELDVAREVGAALLMTPAHVRGVIDEALERAT